MLSLKLYYSTFPLLSVFHIQNTITACINAFANDSIEYSYHRLHGFQEKIDSRPLFEMESLDYDELYRRYDMENHFLKMIDSAIYQNPAFSLSIVRALARKAAERGGASIVDINEITQRSVQKITASQSGYEQSNFTRSMVYELTEAVRRHRLHYGSYSAPIQKIVEYLDLSSTSYRSAAKKPHSC